MYLRNFFIITYEKGRGPSLSKLESPSTRDGCFVLSFVEIGPVVLQNKSSKIRQCNFAVLLLSNLLERAWPFRETNLNPLHPGMLCPTYRWNWPSGSWEEDFYSSSMYSRYFVIISPWKRARPFIWTDLNPSNSNCIVRSLVEIGPEERNVKSLWTYGYPYRRTDERRQAIRKAHLSFQFR